MPPGVLFAESPRFSSGQPVEPDPDNTGAGSVVLVEPCLIVARFFIFGGIMSMLPQNVQSRSDLLPVSPGEISRLQDDAAPFRRREAFSLLASLSPKRRLSLPEAARLLATPDPMVWETAATRARAARGEAFGRRAVLVRPLDPSHQCGNNC